MTRTEQSTFVRSLSESIASDILAAIADERIPADWDGHELRLLLADKFADSATMSVVNRYPARKRAYRRAVIENNLDR